jgi:DNA repair photolyase
MKETGRSFNQIAVEKEDPLPILRQDLVDRKGRPKYPDVNDRRVVYSSPLVDVAANLPTALQTVEACKIILDNTHWQIRLLSKFALLQTVAEKLAPYSDRMIYGFSTGTFNDKVAASLEQGTSSPTARLRALHWLQDNKFRTFAMICPSLPQTDYNAFAREAADRVRVECCEHVWAEVFNLRGRSLKKSCATLVDEGFADEALRLLAVSGKNKAAWEAYARATFLAHAGVVPPEKLRFLQYVQKSELEWWRSQESRGAVLLGKAAHRE